MSESLVKRALSPRANHVSVHRLELLAGSVRRRKFTCALKEAIVSATLTGELMVTDVARRHDLDRPVDDAARVRRFGASRRREGLFAVRVRE
nr:transposase [Rhizobium gallicum]